MGFNDNAAAWKAEQAHKRELDRNTAKRTPDMPPDEDEALRAYKSAHILVPELWDRKRIRALEAHAAANGWGALAEWKAAQDARMQERRERESIAKQDAAARAAQITNKREAIELHKRASDNDDHQLAAAIEHTAQTKGWNLMPTDAHDLATQLHIELQTIIVSHDQASAHYRDDLRAGRVTPEYVKNKLADGTTARAARLQELAEQAAGYVNEAQADYDDTYDSIITPQGDTTQQLLGEIRGGKAWERIQRELTAVPRSRQVGEVIARIGNADPETLRVLIAEAPSYLAAQGVQDADTLVRSAVHEAHPELKDAQSKIITANKLRDLTTYNAGLVANRLAAPTSDDVGTQGLAGYADPTAIL